MGKLKKCKVCGQLIGKDRKSGHYWCPNCKEVREDFDGRMRIVVMGKNAGKEMGRGNFANCMARALRGLGHDVIELAVDYLYGIVPLYDYENCFHFKKPINIKQVQYEYDPDFIYIEQMYYRLDASEITCPVVYQHREYTHFPDMVNCDILLGSYNWRLRAYEFYLPWEYHNIKYKDYLYVAVDPEMTNIQEKTVKGVAHIGLHIPMWQFRNANGPVGDMVMEQQEDFWNECIEKGYVANIPVGMTGKEFLDFLGKCEALLFDAGRFAGFSRRLVEAMASKTLCIVRLHGGLMKEFFKEIGLTEDMCIFVNTPDDVGKVEWTEEEWKSKTDKAYKWVMENHTYDCRAKQLVEIVEEYKKGVVKNPKFMGWSLTQKIMGIKNGALILDE